MSGGVMGLDPDPDPRITPGTPAARPVRRSQDDEGGRASKS